MSRDHDDSRRKFIQEVGAGALVLGAGAAGLGILDPSEALAAKKTRVVVVTGKDPAKMLAAAMKVFRGMGKFVKGKKVVLKPNMSFKNPPTWGNNTNPAVAAAVAAMCKSSGAADIVAIDHTMGSQGRSIKSCGVGPALEKVGGVKVISAHKKTDYAKKRVVKGKQLKTTHVPKVVSASDVLINIPVAKQHNATKVSFGLKNLMGLVWDRRHFHEMINLHQGIADLATLLTPALTVIDASTVMTTNGPQGPGKVQKLHTMVVSTDPVAADAVAVGLTQWKNQSLKPGDVAHIKNAALLGLGQADLSKIKIVKKRT
jgi:uncharacterized protein (DUF362 family)